MKTIDLTPLVQFLYATCAARETEYDRPSAREAARFCAVLEAMPIGEDADGVLAGSFGLHHAEEGFKARFTAWRTAPAPAPASAPAAPDRLAWFQALAPAYQSCNSIFTAVHTTIDFETVLEKGLPGYIRWCESLTPPDAEGVHELCAMVTALRGFRAWLLRFGALSDGAGARACRAIAEGRPETFFEALQLVWLLNIAVGISEGAFFSLSFGRMDQYLWPWFEADRRRGVPQAEMAAAVRDLFIKLNRYADAACNINLGGVAPDGRDMLNDLSRMIADVAAGLAGPGPLLSVRIHPAIAQADFDRFLALDLVRIGQPTFYGEAACRAALRTRGVPEREVAGWAANSCMGIMVPGAEFADMWGVVLSFPVPLELALHGGVSPRGPLPMELRTVCPAEYRTIDELAATVMSYTGEILGWLVEQQRAATEAELPNPYLSALLREGPERGRDRLRGGVRYHTVNVNAFGLVNVADSLTAIEQVVFRERRFPLEAVRQACDADFLDTEELRLQLARAPKYGADHPNADAMLQRLTTRFIELVNRHNTGNTVYMPSFHTFTQHVAAGQGHGATPDGRRAGAPLAKNIGPAVQAAGRGLTALLHSAAGLAQHRLTGGQALDISVPQADVQTVAGRRALQAALQRYFASGGLQIQINLMRADELRAAMASPQEHQDLVVRIAGCSARFVTLGHDVQEELAARMEHGI